MGSHKNTLSNNPSKNSITGKNNIPNPANSKSNKLKNKYEKDDQKDKNSNTNFEQTQ